MCVVPKEREQAPCSLGAYQIPEAVYFSLLTDLWILTDDFFFTEGGKQGMVKSGRFFFGTGREKKRERNSKY